MSNYWTNLIILNYTLHWMNLQKTKILNTCLKWLISVHGFLSAMLCFHLLDVNCKYSSVVPVQRIGYLQITSSNIRDELSQMNYTFDKTQMTQKVFWDFEEVFVLEVRWMVSFMHSVLFMDKVLSWNVEKSLALDVVLHAGEACNL